MLLAEKVIGMAPEGMSKVFFGQSGSDANDTQVKLVWYYWNSRGRPLKKNHFPPAWLPWRDDGLGRPDRHGRHACGVRRLPLMKHTTAPYRLWEAEPGMNDAASPSSPVISKAGFAEVRPLDAR